MNEKLIEKKLREGIKKLGGLALKFQSSYYTGMPDRIVLMPDSKIYFVELKSTGKDLSPNQRTAERTLNRLGIDVHLLDDQTTLDNFLNLVRHA